MQMGVENARQWLALQRAFNQRHGLRAVRAIARIDNRSPFKVAGLRRKHHIVGGQPAALKYRQASRKGVGVHVSYFLKLLTRLAESGALELSCCLQKLPFTRWLPHFLHGWKRASRHALLSCVMSLQERSAFLILKIHNKYIFKIQRIV